MFHFYQDAKVVSTVLAAVKLPVIFANVQHESFSNDDAPSNVDDESEMDFDEFLEVGNYLCVD